MLSLAGLGTVLVFPRLSLLPLIVVTAALGGCSGNPGTTLDELSGELAQDVVGPEAKTASAAAVQAKCGK